MLVVEPGRRLDTTGSGPWSGSGRFDDDDTRRVEVLVGPTRVSELRELERRLERLHAFYPGRGCTIGARSGVTTAEVVRVLDRARAAGFEEVAVYASSEE